MSNRPHLHCHRPIGVFDSGLGGLTVVREIRRRLPEEEVLYFGDLARLPYGIKSREQILRFSIQNTLFLLSRKVKAMVVACNSSSSAAYPFLKRHFKVPMLDVIEPAVQAAISLTQRGRIGVIGTQATIESRVYEKRLKRLDHRLRVFSVPCPLFVPLVEEGWLNGKITHKIIESYAEPLKRKGIDVLILGCTHYPLLGFAIRKVMGEKVILVDSVGPTVHKLTSLLQDLGLSYPEKREGLLKIFVSDKPRNFVRVGGRFLGETLRHVEVVRQK